MRPCSPNDIIHVSLIKVSWVLRAVVMLADQAHIFQHVDLLAQLARIHQPLYLPGDVANDSVNCLRLVQIL